MHACILTSDKVLDVSAGAALDIQGVLRHPPVVTRVRGGQGEASDRQRQRPYRYDWFRHTQQSDAGCRSLPLPLPLSLSRARPSQPPLLWTASWLVELYLFTASCNLIGRSTCTVGARVFVRTGHNWLFEESTAPNDAPTHPYDNNWHKIVNFGTFLFTMAYMAGSHVRGTSEPTESNRF